MENLKIQGHVAGGCLGLEIQNLTPDLARSFGLEEKA